MSQEPTAPDDINRELQKLFEQLVVDGPSSRAALAQIFALMRPVFMRYLRRWRELSNADRENLVQEVFLKLARMVEACRANGNKPLLKANEFPKAYLFKMLWSVRIDEIRRRKSTENIDDRWSEIQDPSWSLQDGAIFDDCILHVWIAFKKSHMECARHLEKVAEGFSGKEIAASLERSEGAARQFLYACRKKLRELIDMRCPGYFDRIA